MRVGLIARATNTGLGYQTLNVFESYKPDATMVLRTGDSRWVDHLDRYPGALIARFDGKDIEPKVADQFIDQVDIVFSVETLYSWSFVAKLRNRRIETVVQGNPEFYRRPGMHGEAPPPRHWVWPTTWMLDEMPPGQVLPMPIPDGAPGQLPGRRHQDGRLTFLHVAGHRAAGDRNGTETFCKAICHLKHPAKVRIIGQDGALPIPAVVPPHVELHIDKFGCEDRWEMYQGVDVLVSPRRYGGLSLPVIEAFAMGVPVLMTDCPPNRDWPILPIPCSTGKAHRAPTGLVPAYECRPATVASQMDSLSADYEPLYRIDHEITRWYDDNDWDALRPRYDEVLGR